MKTSFRLALLVTALSVVDFSAEAMKPSRHNPDSYWDSPAPYSARVDRTLQRTLKLGHTPQTTLRQYEDSTLGSKPIKVGESFAPRTSHRLASFELPISSAWRGSVEDQGDLGTCASFAAVECLKYTHRNRALSQPYMIVKAEKKENCENDGLSIGTAMRVAQEQGVIGQSWWTYSDYRKKLGELNIDSLDPGIISDFGALNITDSESPRDDWNMCVKVPYTKTQEQELVKYAFKAVNSLPGLKRNPGRASEESSPAQKIKGTLRTKNVPVVVAVPVIWDNGWRDRGVITGTRGTVDGRHAITLYGYEGDMFLFKNSWGTGWGESGHGKISSDYINKLATEAWIGTGAALKS